MSLLDRIRKNKKDTQFQEIEEYRDLLETPKEFEDGFNLKTIVGALFVSIVMVPGNIYLELMIGGSIGAAAQWVTIILFIELAKRSFTTLKRQEIYLLYYVTSALINRESGAFEGLLWHQYFVQSPAVVQFGIQKMMEKLWWYAPPANSEAILERTFFHADWFWPITFLVLGMIMGRIAWFSASYVLFRITSDYEKLPFPFAPINAQGAMALAEESSGEITWKWRVFSIGAVIGVVWGAIYVAVPAITGAFMEQPVQLIPIPWVDFTQYTGYFLGATPIGFTLHLGPIFAGFLAPFWAVMGAFIGVMVHTIASPILYEYGFMPHWFIGMDTIQTHFVTGIDFWMSFGIGITFAITIIGFYQVWTGVRSVNIEKQGERTWKTPPGRGDFKIWICVVLFCLASLYTIVLSKILFPDLVTTTLLIFFFVFAFVYTPLISFVIARLDGMVGQIFNIPYIKEATIF
ncbi:MAG: peptide transporter, partial [Candidatus Latescibacterota bacterium]